VWWQQLGLDAAGAARALWLETHPHLLGAKKLAAVADDTDPSAIRGDSERRGRISN
jgi:hypothetical protein